MERRAARELKRHKVSAEAAAKATPNQDRADHEAALAAHMGRHAMATTLAARATNEEAIAARMATHIAALRAGDTVHMQDKPEGTKQAAVAAQHRRHQQR